MKIVLSPRDGLDVLFHLERAGVSASVELDDTDRERLYAILGRPVEPGDVGVDKLVGAPVTWVDA